MYQQYLEKLEKICATKKIAINYFDLKNGYKLPLIKIKYHTNPKATLLLGSGIHGEEIAGPLSVLKFLEIFNVNENKNINLVIFPLLNPSGFETKKRTNSKGFDLNRHFAPKVDLPEDKIIYREIQKEPINFFYSLHEDSDRKTYYQYFYTKKPNSLDRDILSLAKTHFNFTQDVVDGREINHGEIIYDHETKGDHTLEAKLFKNNISVLCTETPMRQKLEKRIDFNVKAIKLVLKYLAVK